MGPWEFYAEHDAVETETEVVIEDITNKTDSESDTDSECESETESLSDVASLDHLSDNDEELIEVGKTRIALRTKKGRKGKKNQSKEDENMEGNHTESNGDRTEPTGEINETGEVNETEELNEIEANGGER